MRTGCFFLISVKIVLNSLIEYMVADNQTGSAVVSSEVSQIAYIGHTGDCFRCRIDTTLFNLAGL